MKLKEIIQKIDEKRMMKKDTKTEIVTTMKSYNETYDYMKYCCRNCRYFDEFYTKYHTYDRYYGYCDYWQDDHEYEDLCYMFVD